MQELKKFFGLSSRTESALSFNCSVEEFGGNGLISRAIGPDGKEVDNLILTIDGDNAHMVGRFFQRKNLRNAELCTNVLINLVNAAKERGVRSIVMPMWDSDGQTGYAPKDEKTIRNIYESVGFSTTPEDDKVLIYR